MPYYLVMFWVFQTLRNKLVLRKSVFTFFIMLAFIIQAFDLSPFFKKTYQEFHVRPPYQTPLKSTLWESAVRDKKMILYYPQEDETYFVPLGLLAANAGMGLNVAYEARFDKNNRKTGQDQVFNQLETGKLLSNALYVFKDGDMYKRLKNGSAHYFLGQADGLFIAYRK
jgi:hypothetical protein